MAGCRALASIWRIRSRVTLASPHLPKSAFFHHRDQSRSHKAFFSSRSVKVSRTLSIVHVVPHESGVVYWIFNHFVFRWNRLNGYRLLPDWVSKRNQFLPNLQISTHLMRCHIHAFSNLFRCWVLSQFFEDFVVPRRPTLMFLRTGIRNGTLAWSAMAQYCDGSTKSHRWKPDRWYGQTYQPPSSSPCFLLGSNPKVFRDQRNVSQWIQQAKVGFC